MITSLSKKKGKVKEKGEKGKRGKRARKRRKKKKMERKGGKGKEKIGFWLTQENMQNLFGEKNHIYSPGGKNIIFFPQGKRRSYIFPI